MINGMLNPQTFGANSLAAQITVRGGAAEYFAFADPGSAHTEARWLCFKKTTSAISVNGETFDVEVIQWAAGLQVAGTNGANLPTLTYA